MMQAAIEQFRENIQRVKNLAVSHAYLVANTELDMSDILRAEVVLIVSALDTFIHNIVRLGMLEILKGDRTQTKKYQEFSVKMKIIRFDERYSWFEEEIRRRHNQSSFQQAESIKKAMEHILETDIWKLVADKLQKDKKDITRKLDLIIKRRNQIAHESDIDPTFPNTRYPIDEQLTRDIIVFVEEIVETIYAILKFR
ncbi:MAG: hypothetical protein KAG43_05520 [Candidatus Marithrix sp.]|nr:hypothetical protein [Candidatus Marithrix sp.]